MSLVAGRGRPVWHLHDLWPELKLPRNALITKKWSTSIGRRLARAEQTVRVRIADLVGQVAPQLLSEPGFGPLTAAKLIGEIAGTGRRAAGLAPIPGQLGQNEPPPSRSRRQPPDQRRNPPRRDHPRPLPPRNEDLPRPQRAEGKTTREAIRCLRRHLARRVWHLLQDPPTRASTS